MKSSAFLATLLASAAFLPIQAAAQTIIEFDMVKSKSIIAGENKTNTSCPFYPSAHVIDHSLGPVENLEVVAKGLPPNTDFVIFNIQVPNAPFGLAWYNGDILTDSTGTGVTNLVGRFSSDTFIVSLAAIPSVNNHPSPPGVLPNSKTGAQVDPVQINHLGIWFDNPADAVKAGCTNVKATPFTSNHDAGPQVLNTGTFGDNAGPLQGIP
jgi:hypothetical protein